MKYLLYLIFPTLLCAKPIKVDEILTEKNKLKSAISILYANINRKNNKIVPVTYQTSNGNFINIPTYVGSENTNQDFVNYGFNLKYGISKNLEIFSNVNFFTSNIRSSGSTFTNKKENGFSNLNLGFTYQIKQENDTPSFLIGGSTNLIEKISFNNQSINNANFKSYAFFAASYYTVDPIVFLFNIKYKLNLKNTNNTQSIQNGNILILSPNIIFAINPYTSINWGFNYYFKNKDKVNNKIISNQESSIGYKFGISYEVDSKRYLNFNILKKDTNDYSSNNINMTFSIKF